MLFILSLTVHTVACEGSVVNLQCGKITFSPLLFYRVVFQHSFDYFSSSFRQMKGWLYLSMVLIMDAMTKPHALTDVLPLRSKMFRAQGQLTKLLNGTAAHSFCWTMGINTVHVHLVSDDTHISHSVHFQTCILSHHSASTAVMAKAAVLSEQATLCLETPASALISTWRWITDVNVSSLKVCFTFTAEAKLWSWKNHIVFDMKGNEWCRYAVCSYVVSTLLKKQKTRGTRWRHVWILNLQRNITGQAAQRFWRLRCAICLFVFSNSMFSLLMWQEKSFLGPLCRSNVTLSRVTSVNVPKSGQSR